MTAPLFFDPAETITGFTFQQPFATAIIGMPANPGGQRDIDGWIAKPLPAVTGPKRAENRGYPPPRTRPLPFWLAVHAGATFYPGVNRETFTRPGFRGGAALWPDCPEFTAMPRRGIVGLARVTGVVEYGAGRLFGLPAYRAVMADPWAFGPFVWTLDKTVVQLATPIPWPKGALGLWTVPPETLALLRAAREDRNLWRTV